MYLSSTARSTNDETFDVKYEPAHETPSAHGEKAFQHPASIDVRPSERGMYLSLSIPEAQRLCDALDLAIQAALAAGYDNP